MHASAFSIRPNVHRISALLLALLFVLAGCAASEPVNAAASSAAKSAGEEKASPVDESLRSATSTSTASGGLEGRAMDGATDGPADDSQAAVEFPTGIVPVHIEIPAIDVDATVIDLDLRGEAPEVPENFGDTGWYQQTRLPGEIGPAVVAGHVDSVSGPAVFARLSLLEPGDEITVTAADGEQRSFVVASTGQYAKTSLPDEVFGFGEPVPELRLITCGGTFDRSVRHYVDNFVVYAVSNSQSPSAL